MRLIAILLGAMALFPSGIAVADKPDNRVGKFIASTDGASKEGAFKVKSVDEEYRILRELGLRPVQQSLVTGDDHKPYDLIEATDSQGSSRQVWFDISSFFGKEF